MICPNCRIDIDAYERDEVERKARQEKEEEFEEMYAHILRPIRKKRAWIGGIVGFVAGAVSFVVIISMILLAPSGPSGVIGFWQEIKKEPWGPRCILALFSLAVFMYSGSLCALFAKKSAGKQERELRESFGLLP